MFGIFGGSKKQPVLREPKTIDQCKENFCGKIYIKILVNKLL